MNATFQISEVFQNSWKFVKSQIWVLAGLCIGFCLLSGVINLCTLPLQGSVSGSIITYAIITIISSVFSLGYVKNMFQIMDGEEPQFSAYMQSLPKVINMWLAGLIYGFVVHSQLYHIIGFRNEYINRKCIDLKNRIEENNNIYRIYNCNSRTTKLYVYNV